VLEPRRLRESLKAAVLALVLVSFVGGMVTRWLD